MVSSVYDLDVYQRAYQGALAIYKLTLGFPKEEQYSLADQMKRASRGICANLAEGFAKGHKSSGEFKRFALMAVGSAEEMRVWLDFSKDLGFIAAEDHGKWVEEYQTICRQLNTLIKKWR